MPLKSAERDGPHMGTSMAAFTQSIQLASSLVRMLRKSKRMSSARITTMVFGALGSIGGGPGRLDGGDRVRSARRDQRGRTGHHARSPQQLTSRQPHLARPSSSPGGRVALGGRADVTRPRRGGDLARALEAGRSRTAAL